MKARDRQSAKASLKQQYEALLAEYGLTPPRPPLNVAQELRAVGKEMIEGLRNNGSQFRADVLEGLLREDYQELLKEPKHPEEMILQLSADVVEMSIEQITKYRTALSIGVYCGVFPTGIINAQVVSVPEGFLVLFNSGLLSAVSSVVDLVLDGNMHNPGDYETNANVIAGVVKVVEDYIRYETPYERPLEIEAGAKGLNRGALREAATEFVIAHEYGHIIAGHFDDKALEFETLERVAAGSSEGRKNWQQEFEADLIGFKILMGSDDFTQVDLAAIDRAYDPKDFTEFTRGLRVMAGIGGPFVVLCFFEILEQIERRLSPDAIDHEDETHPPAKLRARNLLKPILAFGQKRSIYINYSFILSAHRDVICDQVVKSLIANPPVRSAILIHE